MGSFAWAPLHVLSVGIPSVRQKVLGQYLGFTLDVFLNLLKSSMCSG
jgi:hypothetical protein